MGKYPDGETYNLGNFIRFLIQALLEIISVVFPFAHAGLDGSCSTPPKVLEGASYKAVLRHIQIHNIPIYLFLTYLNIELTKL